MIPLKDINRPLTTPHVNRMLIVVNVIIFLVIWLSEVGLIKNIFVADIEEKFVMRPYYIIRGEYLYTLFTSMFLHAGWIHLIGNMLYLYIFGDNIEGALGHGSYLIFYTVCGLAASLAYLATLKSFSPQEGVVGASGAISGILGAYLVFYPKTRILTLLVYVIVPIPAIIFLGFWFLMQWYLGMYDIAGNVAYWAHVGGFIAGMVLALTFGLKRKKAREARFRF